MNTKIPVESQQINSNRLTALRWLVYPLLLLALAYFAISLWQNFSDTFAYDFAVNWTATRGLQQGISLYDRPALQTLGMSLISDPSMKSMFAERFNSFDNPPTTALLIWPFALLPFATALGLYRAVELLALGGAIWLATLALPAAYRRWGLIVGLLGLFTLRPVVASVRLGQLDGWLLLGLALSLWSITRRRWAVAGAGAAVAALLKVSPGLILLYLVLRGKWQALVGAAATAIVALGLSALLGRPDDIRRFVFEVFPEASSSTLYAHNQSLPAWLARLFLPENNLAAHEVGIGPFVAATLPLTLLGLALVWFVAGRTRLHPLTVSLLIPVTLLASPITWNHYLSWMLLPLVQMADGRAWGKLSTFGRLVVAALLAAGLLLMSAAGTAVERTILADPAGVASHWWWRVISGLGPMGVICWFAAGLLLLAQLRNEITTAPVTALETSREQLAVARR